MASTTLLYATQLVAAALMLGLAVWLARAGPPRLPARLFALALLFDAATIVVLRLPGALGGDAIEAAGARVQPYYEFAQTGALVAFLWTYPTRGRAITPLLVVGALVGLAEAAYFLDHCAVRCGSTYGPLGPVLTAAPLVAAGGAWRMLRAARAHAPGHARTSLLLVGAAFLIDATVDGGAVAVALPFEWASFFPPGTGALRYLAFLLPAAGALLALGLALGARGRIRAAGIAGFAVGALAGLVTLYGGAGAPEAASIALLGAGSMTMPILVGVALARYRLFGIERRGRVTFTRASVGAFFGAVFFVVSETVAVFLGPRIGTLAGIGAAGALLFALAPLQRAAEGVVTTALGPPRRELEHEDRVGLYRELAQRAWADGAIDPTERRFLEDLRARLGLTLEETARLEADITLR